jgi:DNA-directed RNA polymerase specialized sigma24 family protein
MTRTSPSTPVFGSPCSSFSRPRREPVIAHDVRAFQAGLIALVPELRSRALRLAQGPALADDLVQDTMERALRFADQYERGTNLRAWVQQILFSVFVTRYRRARRERNALRALAVDPCAWTHPERFAAPDASAALTPSTQERLDSRPGSVRSSRSSTSSRRATAKPRPRSVCPSAP